ncbi:unnamed protein product [Adineta steineri]|uniref:Uncharacterized protein n=1 Tax=Adineta steineri TaxID=433720 RepID=A0A813YAU1_9BILA|nr:unnamed protein product [Adineta steineri]
MATSCCRSTHTSNNNNNTNKNGNECNVELFPISKDGDWSRAIHHDLNIKRRTCTTFIVPKEKNEKKAVTADQSTNDPQCSCKRLRREHSWDLFEKDGNNVKWNKDDHTRSAYNNAYGYIPNTRSHYIRCDIETEPKILAKLMFDVWKVKPPRLIMCIIGGAKYFKLNERLEREFMKGIIQAALKADGWIVTTGFKTGVVQLVGEAIHDHKVTNPRSHITAIGCSKWGAVRNRESLISSKKPSKGTLDPSKNISNTRKKGEQDLEPNHTHFLLLDDGTYYNYDTGDYRSRFVLDASSYKHKDASNQQHGNLIVPVVTIVVEGGPDTLLTIYKDLRRDIPIVLIDGSGRVPNKLANYLARTESMIHRIGKEEAAKWKDVVDVIDDNDKEKLKNKFQPYESEIRDDLRDIAKGLKNDEAFDELFYCILYCLQPAVRSRILVYSLDGDHDLDDTIFEAIIHANLEKSSVADKASTRKQLLLLALAWDAIEVAKELIIKDDLSDLDESTKAELFFEALRRDRSQFVNTFIKLNFDITKMFYEGKTNKPWKLKWDKLSDIYNNDHEKNVKERLYLLNKCHGGGKIEHKEELDRILRKLIGDYMKPTYSTSVNGPIGRLSLCCGCPQRGRVSDSRTVLYKDDNNYDDDDSEVPDPEEAKKEAQELVYRDLFFWSILTNRIEMSKVLLRHMQTRICAALIASKVLKSYAKFARDNESKDVLRSEAENFEEYAKECLKCCYNCDEAIACEIAIRRINIFGGVSCLQVAVDANDKNFVGQPCCDQLLTNVWYDKLEPLQLTMPKRIALILSLCTFGLLAPFLLSFRKPESETDSIDNFLHNQNKTYGMTVNETEEEEEERKKLLSNEKKKLDNHGINYSDIYTSKSKSFSNRCKKYFRRLKQFHEAPFIKFLYNCASYTFFLLLFSYYLLFNFNIPTDDIPSIHWTEILVIIYVTTMLMEDFRRFLCLDNRTFFGKLHNYFVHDLLFSSIRIASYVLFYIGLILRFVYASDDEQLSVAKIILAYDLEIFYIRSLAFLNVAKNLGPKLVMIRKMIIDLFFFICIILIAMLAYGAVSRSMYDFGPDANGNDLTFDGRSIFRHIIYPVYYLMYGSTDSETGALDQNPDMATSIATHILLAFHMLFVNILLINLLIAMFSYTFEAVQRDTDLVWRYERYSLVREYFGRPPLFPPFIIITHFIEIIKLIIRHLPGRKRSSSKPARAKTFKMVGANRKIDKDWSEFESYATNLYARRIVSGQPTSAAALVPSAARQELLSSSVDAFNVPSLTSNLDVKAITDEMTSIKKVVGDLRTYAEEMNRCMQWMMDAMDRVKMSKEPKPRLRSALTTSDVKLTDDQAFL